MLGEKLRSKLLFWSSACSLALACQTSTDLTRDLEPPIQTDALSYLLSSDGYGLKTTIPYTYENRTGTAVYLINCNGDFALRLERLDEGAWVTAWGPFLNDCLSPPIVIDSGATYADTLQVWGAAPGQNWIPTLDASNPVGVYRLVWLDALSSFQDRLPFGEQIPLAHRVSNQFALAID